MNFTQPILPKQYSYHNHSRWSDGGATILEMCTAAKNAGYREFGMSDHCVCRPGLENEPVSWAMAREQLQGYFQELQSVKEALDDENFTVRRGLEIDFFPQNFPLLKQLLEPFSLDYRIGASHYADGFSVDADEKLWEPLSQAEIDHVWEAYWENVLALVETGYFQILAHLDLPKKFAYKPTRDQTDNAMDILRAVKKNGMALEINTAGWDKPCKECYPSPKLIRAAREMQIPIVISSDSHAVKHIGRNYDKLAL